MIWPIGVVGSTRSSVISIDAAQEQLAALGLTVVPNELPQDGVAPGVVYDQSPAAGSSFEIGNAIP